VYHADYRKLKNQARFIKEIIDGELLVGKKKKAILVQELRDRDYEAFPPGGGDKKKTADEEDEGEENQDVEGDMDSGARDYDFLLSVSALPKLAMISELIRNRCPFGL
jgi:DNA topoisomerase-2